MRQKQEDNNLFILHRRRHSITRPVWAFQNSKVDIWMLCRGIYCILKMFFSFTTSFHSSMDNSSCILNCFYCLHHFFYSWWWIWIRRNKFDYTYPVVSFENVDRSPRNVTHKLIFHVKMPPKHLLLFRVWSNNLYYRESKVNAWNTQRQFCELVEENDPTITLMATWLPFFA